MRARILAIPLALGLFLRQVPALADESVSASATLGGSAGVSSTSTPASAPAKEDTSPKQDEVSTRTFLSWTAIGVGAMGIGLFVVQMVRFGEIRDERDAAAAKVPAGIDVCTAPPTSPNFVDARTACDRDETATGVRNLGLVGLVGGLALVTTGVVLLATDKKASSDTTNKDKKEEPKASWRLAPVVGPTNGLVAVGSF